METKILLKRGNEANLPVLDVGEPAFTIDTKKPFIGSSTGNVELATSTQLESIASGSPKAVFDTLALLEADVNANTAEGKKSIYLVLDDGKWYYWDGTAWAAGGIYQSASAKLMPIEDEGSVYEADNVEDALQEVKTELDAHKSDYAQQIADINTKISIGRLKTDDNESPGSWYLFKGDTEAGFYGFVQPSEMGLITANPEANRAYNGTNLALALGLSSGTAFNPNVPLMKFHYKGKVLFIPLTGYRYSVSWDDIYNAGIAYSTVDEGFLPPTGRVGTNLNIDAADNSINCTTQRFLGDKSSAQDYADTVGAVGDTLILKGWTNEANNKTVTIETITDTKIIVSGATLVTEAGGKKSRFYNNAKKVTQGKTVAIGDKTYSVYLMTGAGDNPIDSYADADRGAAGPNNMWNKLILPLHEHAKLGNWAYPAYAIDENGVKITSDWDIGLTDENLRTHYDFGSGSYAWCQEVLDTVGWRRVNLGYRGASSLGSGYSWVVNRHSCWRPVLEAL